VLPSLAWATSVMGARLPRGRLSCRKRVACASMRLKKGAPLPMPSPCSTWGGGGGGPGVYVGMHGICLWVEGMSVTSLGAEEGRGKKAAARAAACRQQESATAARQQSFWVCCVAHSGLGLEHKLCGSSSAAARSMQAERGPKTRAPPPRLHPCLERFKHTHPNIHNGAPTTP
jgi:hypothetical protein